MRILQTHNYYQQAGGEDLVFAEESALLRNNGHAVHQYSVHNDSVRSLSKIELARKTFWNQDSFDEVARIIRENEIDILHSHNTLPLLSPAIYYAARQEGAAVVQTLHNYRLLCPSGLFYRNEKVCEDCLGKSMAFSGIIHSCYRGSRVTTAVVASMINSHRRRGTWENEVDAYISLTHFAKSRFVAGGLPDNLIHVKPNFVSKDSGTGEGNGGYILFVGRLSEEKGIRTLLRTWKDSDIGLTLKIIGTGPLSDQVKKVASLDHNIEYLGFLSQEEVKTHMKNAAATVVSSVWYETFGRVVVESFSVGTPVIASRIGALSELLSDGETGLLFEAGNSEDLKEKLHSFKKLSKERSGQMRANARRAFETKYNPAVNYSMLRDIYQFALDAKKS